VLSRQVHLVAYPADEIRADHFRVIEVELPAPGPEDVLVRNTWTSVDPGMRLRLAESAPAGYFAPFALKAPLDGIMTVGEVVDSRADGFARGDLVWHTAGWREHAVVRAGEPALRGLGTLARIDGSVAPAQAYLGPLGGVGLTAYAGLLHAAELREGDVVWVSAAAGAVGSLVAQIAKLLGHRVIGSAGSRAKVAFLRDELGLDAAFDYHDGPVDELLRAAAPDGIDVYFDNVGGDHLEAALAALRRGGRVALCGAVSTYEARPAGPRNLFQATANDLTLRGFRGSSHVHRFPDLHRHMTAWLAAGRVKARETVFDGLASAPEALVRMLAGETVGKTLVRLGQRAP
jgi:NADPH-dependent curcumin reductase CurA